MAGPPELKPLSRAPINLKMTNDSKIIFDTVAKLAGLTVVFDPDFTSRRIAAELTNVTLEQALDIVSLEAKAFWKPVTNDIIFVAPDQAQKRRDYEEEIVRTIYLKNTHSAAGSDGNRQRPAPIAGPAPRAAIQRAERHHRARHAG